MNIAMPAVSTSTEPEAEPVGFVIFGVTGDLTRRKLFPALYQLARDQRLPTRLTIIGLARRDWADETLREELRSATAEFARSQPVDEAVLEGLCGTARYVRSAFDNPEGYDALKSLILSLGIKNVLFYLATPPESYPEIIRRLGECGMAQDPAGWRRVVIEKPYGRDLESARELNRQVHRIFREEQVYRIDHYLGKETVQNILVLRFANGIFEPLWSRHYVDYVKITVAETGGVGTRAGYYDTAGVIRDVFQNHLLQLLTLTAMEAPVAFNPDAVRNEKVKVLQALRPLRGEEANRNTCRAQYVSGTIEGKRVPGYKDEPGVSPGSTTETYLAARVFVDNWRWAGVPFYIRSGKRLARHLTEIAIQFLQVPLSLFDWRNTAGDGPNALVLNIQPDEGITLTFGAKAPGPVNTIAPVKMNFSYAEAFGSDPPEAYERLLLDVLLGDSTLFNRSDEVLAAWAFTTDVLEAWAAQRARGLTVYEAGTWGPPAAEDFIGRDKHTWGDSGT